MIRHVIDSKERVGTKANVSRFLTTTPDTTTHQATWRLRARADALSAQRKPKRPASYAKRCLTAAGNVRQPICTSISPQPTIVSKSIDFSCSMSHRQSCKFKERYLAVQECCAVCGKLFSETGVPTVACEKCFGIKYCSEQCKGDNE